MKKSKPKRKGQMNKNAESNEEKIVYRRYLPEDSSDEEYALNRKAKKNRNPGRDEPNISCTVKEEENTVEENADEEPQQTSFPVETVLTKIKNRVRRLRIYNRMKKEKRRAKKQLKQLKMKEDQPSGKKNKCIVHTLESKREEDITITNESDEDLEVEEARDSFSTYYAKKYIPKILITASDLIHGKTMKFIKELALIIPNAFAKWRHKCGLQKLVTTAHLKGFTDIMIVNEDHRLPSIDSDINAGLLIIHLPDGPSALFRLSNVKVCKEIRRNSKAFTGHRPELILNNFKTRLGRVIARMFGALFHFEPEFKGRSVCTLHNQRDYIFFRYHRYQFRNAEKVRLKELGPRFTLRLEWLRRGTFGGDYEWSLKRHEMETSRTRFFL